MIGLRTVTKEENIWDNFFSDERMSQANVLVGPSGIGKKTSLLKKISGFFCANKNPQGCGECGGCRRILLSESEFHIMIKPDEQGTIKVEEIRRIKKTLSLKTLQKKFFVIIDDAETMTLQSSNALLKVLEEPPQDCYFFLVTSCLDLLPATIRSRTQILRLNFIDGVTDANSGTSAVSPWAHSLARSQRDLAQKINEISGLKQDIVDWVIKNLSGSISLDNFPKEQLGVMLFFIRTLLRDAIFKKSGLSHKILNVEFSEGVISQLANSDSQMLFELYEKINDYEKQIDENVDKSLIWDNLTYSLKVL